MSETISGTGKLRIQDSVLDVAFTVPVGKCPPQSVLPDVQRFADQVTDYAQATVEAAGLQVS